MGNEGSKPKGNTSLSRSDTMNSTKSSRSLRSRRSFNKEKIKDGQQTMTTTTTTATATTASSHNTPSLKPPSIMSRRSSFKSNKSNKSTKSNDISNTNIHNTNANNNSVDSDHYDYIYDEEFDHNNPQNMNTSHSQLRNDDQPIQPYPEHTIYTQPNTNNTKSANETHMKLPPSMAIVKPKSPILRMNSSTSINDNSIQHLSSIEKQHSNTDSNNVFGSMSRRNSTNTVNSSNSRNSRNSRNSSTHGIPIDAFNDMCIHDTSSSSNIFTISTLNTAQNSPTQSNSRSRSSTAASNRMKAPFDENNLSIPSSNITTTTTNTSITSNNNDDIFHPNTDKLVHNNAKLESNNEISHDDTSDIKSDNINPVPEITLSNFDYRRKYDLNIEDLIQRLLDAGYSGKRTKSVCLKNSEIALICSAAREIFLSQPSLLELSAPVKIVGDVHGQYIDLIRIFSKCGFPPASNYLFLGDYVDRGKQSLETILLLLCYKIKFPENFFLLRGNHECAQITRQYGFYDECKRRTNLKTWKLFVDTFNTLPIAAIVASKIFCVHGGLSPVLNSMDEIRNIRRPTDVPDFGLLNDLLWSDPADSPNQWEDNERGVSYCFNKVAINNFLNKFQFDLVVRAHMVVEDGYEFFNDRSLVTVFSAPNYCGEFDNWGAVMGVSEELLCAFELLDPLDSMALKSLMKKGRIERRNAMLTYNSTTPTTNQSEIKNTN